MGCLQGSASDPHRDQYRIHIGSMYGPQRGPCFAITVFCWGNFAGGGGGVLYVFPQQLRVPNGLSKIIWGLIVTLQPRGFPHTVL